MPADPAIQLDHLGEVRDALAAVCAVHDEYGEFFAGVFSRLESMSDVVRARDQQIEELQQQQRLWEQERSALERELEAVRNRAAEMNETITQQKRDAENQQNQWSGELKRVRKALQRMAERGARRDENTFEPSAELVAPRSLASVAAPGPDPVLDSVMAQFEVLRKDVARRRDTRRS
ncbi:MAG: hypothetical protein U1E05_16460 [Patescibacteria group bacterium]|nr:hypothetical protein [Patescibacteria group bacterium]